MVHPQASVARAAPNASDRVILGLVAGAFGLGAGGLVWIALAVRSCLAIIGGT